MLQIESDLYRIRVQERGGELNSLFDKKQEKELLWQAQPPWQRHAPVLFPTIGGFAEGTYYVDGIPYQMTPHGFARDLDFTPISHTESEIVMELQDSEDTHRMYPYAFSLKIGYQLLGDGLQIQWTVENRDQRVMYYSIGAHPAFMLSQGSGLSDYELVFDAPVELRSHQVQGRLVTKDTWLVSQATERLRLSPELLRKDALVFEGGISGVLLRRIGTGEGIRMEFPGFPVLAVWTAPESVDRARFLCLEPWCGLDDFVGQNPAELSQKYLINRLSPGESRTFRHSIRSMYASENLGEKF